MREAKQRRVAAKIAPQPAWVSDTANQAEWTRVFLEILKRDYEASDPTISAILRNERLAKLCAAKVRSYVDKNITHFLYGQRKARGVRHKNQLETAIEGLRVAVILYTDRGNHAAAMELAARLLELSGELGRCRQAFSNKRHGRDRAHSILSECHAFLQSELGQPVTNATLATLVTVGNQADGQPDEEIVTEEHIRKNLTAFRRNNPMWSNQLDPRYSRLALPATK